MKRKLALAAACFCALAAAAASSGEITKEQYQAQRSRIQDQYATSKDRCSSTSGHARDLCKVQARAEYDMARAELMARYRPTPSNRQEAAQAKAEGDWRIAREKCGDLAGSARKVCEEDAKANFTAARADARAERTAQDKGIYSTQALAARDKARETSSQARFNAERERCETLSGDAKANCMADAKKRFDRP